MPTYTVATILERGIRLRRGVVAVVCLAAAFAGAAEPAVTSSSPTNENARSAGKPGESVQQKWGIEATGLFLSAGGNMVDFRYKVLDPAKAAFLTKPETKPELIDQTSGAKLIVPDSPKVGQLRQITRQPVVGKTYFILFANTRGHVKSGDKVTIAAGDFRLENLIVE